MNQLALTEERKRIFHGVVAIQSPPELVAMEVTPELAPQEYLNRIRSVLGPAVALAQRNNFDVEILPTNSIPVWFSEVSNGAPNVSNLLSNSAHSGAQRYISRLHQNPWDLQEWLFCFDPERRGWSWWDATVANSGTVTLWLDTLGEPTVPWDDFIWLAYVTGALSVNEATLKSSDEWYALKKSQE